MCIAHVESTTGNVLLRSERQEAIEKPNKLTPIQLNISTALRHDGSAYSPNAGDENDDILIVKFSTASENTHINFPPSLVLDVCCSNADDST